MALTKETVIWTGKTTGVILEEYQGKYSLKGVRSYQKGGDEVLTYDWVYAEVYDKDAKKRVISEKPRPGSVYLGNRDEAARALGKMIKQLGGTLQDIPEDMPPF